MKKILLASAFLAALTCSAQHTKSVFLSTAGESLNIENVTGLNVKLSRYIFQGYNTLCLPYSLTRDEVAKFFGADVTLEKPVGATVENGEFQLCFADCTTEGIEAGMPYLLHSNTAKVARISVPAGTYTSTPLSVSFSDNSGNYATFAGSFERISPVGTYAIPAVEGEIPANLVRCDGTRRLNPTRCFFTWDTQNGEASAMVIKHLGTDAEVTGLNNAIVSNSDAPTFNTIGQRVNNARGIVIQNGKKVIK